MFLQKSVSPAPRSNQTWKIDPHTLSTTHKHPRSNSQSFTSPHFFFENGYSIQYVHYYKVVVSILFSINPISPNANRDATSAALLSHSSLVRQSIMLQLKASNGKGTRVGSGFGV